MYGCVDQGYYFIMDHFEAKSMLEIWLIFESQICKHLAKFEPRFGYMDFLDLTTLCESYHSTPLISSGIIPSFQRSKRKGK